MHETGHIIGFIHPEDGNAANHVANTAFGTGYSTVMHASFGEPGLSGLTNDDLLARNALYP